MLYVGITNSLASRVWQHRHGEISGFTKTYKVNRLVYYESFNDPRDAISREKQLKGWRRSKKNKLVETQTGSGPTFPPCSINRREVSRALRCSG